MVVVATVSFRLKIKGWTLIVWADSYRGRQAQDICETDGFLLQPLHIFISFLELYDTVFHMPGEDPDTQ